MSGVKGRSGRKRNFKNAMLYLNETLDANWFDLVDALLEKAKNGDKECLMYCFDRRLGKPTAVMGVEGEGLSKLLFMAVLEAGAEARRMIDIPTQDVIQLGEGGENGQEGTDQE